MTFTIVLGETLAKLHPQADLYIDRWLASYGEDWLRELGITEILTDPSEEILLARLDAIEASNVRILTTLQGRDSLALLGKVANRLRDRGVAVTIVIEPLPEHIREPSGAPRVELHPAMDTTPPRQHPLRVFLCHCSADKVQARELHQVLVDLGVDVWFDEQKLLPGQDWRAEIQRAVRASHLVLVCLSRRAIDRTGFVQREIRLALDAAEEQPEDSLFIIPVKLEECDVPERLARWQWLNRNDPVWKERLGRTLNARADELRRRASATDA